MTISNSATTLLDSALSAEGAQQDAQVSVLKKAQDMMKLEGSEMAQMLSQVGQVGIQPAGSGQPLLDAYA